MGGRLRRWLAVAAASILVLAAVTLTSSCWNPLTIVLQALSRIDLVVVDGGDLLLGDVEGYFMYVDEVPTHWVTISPFQISRFEVTQQLYEAVMGGNPSWFRSTNGYSDEPLRPVESVTWLDAIEFCNAMSSAAGLEPAYLIDTGSLMVEWNPNADGYRLPTEAEWEYAARGGQFSLGTWFAGSDDSESVSWNVINATWDPDVGAYIPHPVGELAANELGLYDMSGNVCEWVWDLYSASYYGDNFDWNDPPGPAEYWAPILTMFSYVARGGSVNSDGTLLRNAMRFAAFDDSVYIDFGFRLARNF